MILCIGTTPVLQRTMVFPRVEIDAVNRATTVFETASGKSLNVARVLHTLGESVLATGFLGGASGDFIRADLNALELPNDFLSVAPKTRMCITVMDRQRNHATELVEESQPIMGQYWHDLRATIKRHLANAKLLVLSGSLPKGAPADFYAWCIARAASVDVRVILDASGGPLQSSLAERPFLIKPNRAELANTLGISLDADQLLRDAVKGINARWTLVTEGKARAILSNGQEFWRLRPPEVTAINPIGSGDSVAAGMAAGIVRGLTMLEAAKLGMACGAANAETLTAGVVDRDRVVELTDRVEVESW